MCQHGYINSEIFATKLTHRPGLVNLLIRWRCAAYIRLLIASNFVLWHQRQRSRRRPTTVPIVQSSNLYTIVDRQSALLCKTCGAGHRLAREQAGGRVTRPPAEPQQLRPPNASPVAIHAAELGNTLVKPTAAKPQEYTDCASRGYDDVSTAGLPRWTLQSSSATRCLFKTTPMLNDTTSSVHRTVGNYINYK